MKMKMNDMVNAVNKVSVTKADITMNCKEGAVILASTDVASGIEVQSRFGATDVKEEKVFYLPCSIKEGLVALSSAGDEVAIEELTGSVKFLAGQADISVGKLAEQPAGILVGEPYAAYQFSGKEFVNAMNVISSVARKGGETFTCCYCLIKGDTLEVFGTDGNRMVKNKMRVLQQQIRDDKAFIDSTVIVYDKDTQNLGFAIDHEIWKKISSACSPEFVQLYVCEKQVRLSWKDSVFVLPLYDTDKLISINGVCDSTCEEKDGDVVFELNIADFYNAVNIVSVVNEDKRVSLKAKGKNLTVKSLNGSAKLAINDVGEGFSGDYNVDYLKEHLSFIKSTEKTAVKVATSNKCMISLDALLDYTYGSDNGEVVQQVEVVQAIMPVKE
ncbi:MAG: hypothetical protein K6G88_10975 [Lachnospiraceae bacterium]|nr:hypothetical protein [Lachnospiraceae bacterium]